MANEQQPVVRQKGNLDMESAIGERLRWCAAQVGGVEKLSELSDVPRRSLEDYIAGKAEMKSSRLFALADAARVSPVWLQTGRGERAPSAVGEFPSDDGMGLRAAEPRAAYGVSNVERLIDEFVFVPRLVAQVSAGPGRSNARESASGTLAFRRDWVVSVLRASPSALRAVEISGDSMWPTLADGDVVLLSIGDSEVRDDGIYAFGIGDDVFVKRIQRQGGGRLVAHSDNREKYEPFEIPVSGDARIIGRVLWSGGRI